MRSLITVALALTSGACVQQVWSPPAGYPSIETPDRLAEGQQSVSLSGGFGGLGIGADILGGNVKYRRGLGAVELQGEGAFALINEDSEADTFPAIISGKVSVKGRLVPSLPHFSWKAGLGFGGSAGGVFTAGDLALTAGFENPWVVPFLSLLGGVSVPITSEDVDITKAGDEDPIIDHPITSFHAGLTLGIGVPIADTGWKLSAAFTRLELYRIRGDHEGVSQLSFGVEVGL